VTSSEKARTADEARRARWELVILGTMYVGYAAFMLCRLTLVATSPAMLRDPMLTLDKRSYGKLMGWSSAGAIGGKLLTGVAADRIGGRWMFLIALVLTAISTAAFGVVSAFYSFALLNFAGQFFKAGGWPAMAKLIGNWYPENKHGRVWAILATSSRVGTIGAGVLVGMLLTTSMPWRGTFFVVAAIALVIVLLGWFLLKDKPADVGLMPPAEIVPVPLEPEPEAASADAHPLAHTTLRQALLVFAMSPRVWLICIAMMFLTILMDFINFIPLYLTESMNLAPTTASMAGTGIFPAGMFVALIVSAAVYDRFSKRQLVLVLGGLLALSSVCGAILWVLPTLPIPDAVQPAVAFVTIFVLGFAVSPAYYLPMSVFSIAYGGRHSGFLIAFIDVAGYAGALVFNYFAGGIAQDYGWTVFLGGLLAIALSALVSTTSFLHLDYTAEKRIRPLNKGLHPI
jgi:OPA family sugar phosphate sensor protein UhpC-like MFS transporter